MRTNIDFDQIEESKPKAGVKAGAYVCRITNATDYPAKEYVEVIWDIAEGEFKDNYSDQWGEEHPYAHHFYMSYKDTALGFLKMILNAISASNPGFDASAAWNGGRLDMFNGRLVGLNLRDEEYEKDGEVRTRLVVGGWAAVQDVRAGVVKPMGCKKLQNSNNVQQSSNTQAHVIDMG